MAIDRGRRPKAWNSGSLNLALSAESNWIKQINQSNRRLGLSRGPQTLNHDPKHTAEMIVALRDGFPVAPMESVGNYFD